MEAGGRGRGGGASRVQAEDPTVKAAGRGTRGAHLKHGVHFRDAGRVPAQRLVEHRGLPSRKGKHEKSGDRRAGRREGVGAAAQQAGCRQRTRLWRLLAGARAERTMNMPYMVVTLDVSQLSGWLNADCCRVERESIKRAATCRPGGGRAWARRRRKQRAGRGPDCGGCWQGHARSAREKRSSCP
jgi:hypothetical protein